MKIDPNELLAFEKDTAKLWRAPVVSTWAPQWADHIIGVFGERALGLDGFEPQKYRCFCFFCRTEHQGECATGAVRNHVCHFASAHVHCDVMAVRSKPA